MSNRARFLYRAGHFLQLGAWRGYINKVTSMPNPAGSFFLPLAAILLWRLLLSPHAEAQQTIEMVSVPPGPFVMGSNDGPADERPAHKVNLPGFLIDRIPVTNAQFAGFLN